jgi:hypothetical protein
LAEEGKPPLRGGSIQKRDDWYPIGGREGFKAFKRWYHRKKTGDDATREELEDWWNEWVEQGKPGFSDDR